MNMSEKTDLKGLTRKEMEEFAEKLGEKPFRGRQLFSWIYARGISDFNEMTDISRGLKEKLNNAAFISSVETTEQNISDTGNTEKFLFRLADGSLIESVLMHYDEQPRGRLTACISSQVGCAQGCAFCASGVKGLHRNLTAGEITDQVIALQKILDPLGRRIHNVVIMGIGEPLANYDAVMKAVRLLNDGNGPAIGMRRLALSTVGIPPLIKKFAHEGLDLRFAVSLHAADDDTRNRIMPVNRKHPIKELMDACRYYQNVTGRRITIEYALIENLNDSSEDAHKLINLLRGLKVLVNLIPLNPVEHFPYRRPSRERCVIFAREIEKAGFKVALRNERGVGIDAACGQLRLRFDDNSDPNK